MAECGPTRTGAGDVVVVVIVRLLVIPLDDAVHIHGPHDQRLHLERARFRRRPRGRERRDAGRRRGHDLEDDGQQRPEAHEGHRRVPRELAGGAAAQRGDGRVLDIVVAVLERGGVVDLEATARRFRRLPAVEPAARRRDVADELPRRGPELLAQAAVVQGVRRRLGLLRDQRDVDDGEVRPVGRQLRAPGVVVRGLRRRRRRVVEVGRHVPVRPPPQMKLQRGAVLVVARAVDGPATLLGDLVDLGVVHEVY